MTIQEETAFTTLLQRWNRHHDLRRSGAPIAELATSRFDLEAARLACARTQDHRLAA